VYQSELQNTSASQDHRRNIGEMSGESVGFVRLGTEPVIVGSGMRKVDNPVLNVLLITLIMDSLFDRKGAGEQN
jgi:hypothetical protein